MITGKVMYFDKRPPQIEKIFIEAAQPDIDLCFYEPSFGTAGDLKDVEVLICNSRGVKKEIMDQAPKLKMISIAGIGFDQHDLEYARERGIYISNCRDGASECVAEYDIGLMIALYRRIVQLANEVKQGKWQNWEYRHDTYSIEGKTLGVIGAGGIGQAVLRKGRAFNMRELYYDVLRMPEELEEAMGAQYVDMDTLLRESDVVMLLVPLMDSTYHMLGAKEFAKMKKTAIIINDSRGECIDQDALVEALKSKQIWGAALDVVTPEPLPKDAPIQNIEGANVIITPHQGSSTVEIMTTLFRDACDNGLRCLNGERPINICNGL